MASAPSSPRPGKTKGSLPLVRTLSTVVSGRRFVVHGSSMDPAFRHGDRLLVDRLSYRLQPPARGDVVVLYHPPQQGQGYIKRIVGLPQETVQLVAEGVLVNGALIQGVAPTTPPFPVEHHSMEWTLGDEQYFVLGDRRDDSWDSRRFGPIWRSQIVGRVLLRYWPPPRWALLPGRPGQKP